MKYLKTYKLFEAFKNFDFYDEDPNRQLLDACFGGNFEFIKDALERGADPNIYDNENYNVLPIEYVSANVNKTSINVVVSVDTSSAKFVNNLTDESAATIKIFESEIEDNSDAVNSDDVSSSSSAVCTLNKNIAASEAAS